MHGMRVFAVALVALLASIGLAQAPFNYKEVDNRNIRLKVEVGLEAPFGPLPTVPPEDPILISRTNVNVTFEAGAAAVPYGGSNGWTSYEIDWVDAQVSGTDGATAVTDDKRREYGAPNDGVGSQIARFASTAFDHGSTVNVLVRANWTLTRTVPGSDLETLEVTLEHTVPLEAYNVAVPWGTKEVEGENGFEIDDPITAWSVAATAHQAMHLILISSTGSLMTVNHLVDPSTAATALEQQEDELQAKFGTGTYFVTVTHGQFDQGACVGLRAS